MKTKLIFVSLLVSHLHLFAGESDAPTEDFVAHEWGTFTSVQGADGIQREWNPLTTTELPTFVYDLFKPSGQPRRQSTVFGAKTAFRTLQRMETPVIYFYSDRERTVDVTVKFPQGVITEWYPQAREIGPTHVQPRALFAAIDKAASDAGLSQKVNLSSLDTRKSIKESLIHWADVKILPTRAHTDIAHHIPGDGSGSHYYAARETDAEFLRVKAQVNGSTKDEHEKFLFYRGVGSFVAPLAVSTGAEADYLSLRNTGTEALTDLFVLQQRGREGKFIHVDRLPAGEDKSVKLLPGRNILALGELMSQISDQMCRALVRAGLYEREAQAMVKTWRDSWFQEEGLRVLYILPRVWTDKTLPITLNPKPRELVRVMVGRAEVITPVMEWELLKQIVKYSEADPATQQKVIEETRKVGLGRFAEPAMRKVLGNMPSREFSNAAWELLEATGKPGKENPKALAAN